MRVFAAVLLGISLAASPLLAGNANETGKEDAPAAVTSASAVPDKPTPVKPEASAVESEMQELRSLIEEQSAELEAQRAALKAAEAKMKELEERMGPSLAQPAAASAPALETVASPAVGPVIVSNVAPAEANPGQQTAQTDTYGKEQPRSWNFKGVTFTPGGFFAAESVWRQRGLGADVNTPFTSIPLPGASQYQVGEFNASGRQSRIAMLVQGDAHNVKLGGYYEADFLSAGTTSNDNQSNSYTLRQRQFWAQAAFNSGFTLTGGQMWSLVTQTAKGLDNRTEVLPETIDAQYSVGFSWARQYGMRFVQNFHNKVWLGFSVEAPQTTFKVAGTTTPFLVGEAGTSGGLYNPTANYSFNMTPDFIVKAAFEPGFGHYEVFGLASTFRDRVFPTGLSPYNGKTAGGGGGASAWFPFANGKVNIGLHALAGSGGVGRTARWCGSGCDFATGRDDRSNPQLSGSGHSGDPRQEVGRLLPRRRRIRNARPVHFRHAVSAYPERRLRRDWFQQLRLLDGGGARLRRIRAGIAGKLQWQPQNMFEGTGGLWYSFYAGQYGTLKLGLQYSYVKINTWTGLGATGVCSSAANPSCTPSPNENMVFTSLRFYIP